MSTRRINRNLVYDGCDTEAFLPHSITFYVPAAKLKVAERLGINKKPPKG
jgi:hypothetical protein